MSSRVLLDNIFDIIRPQSFLKPLLVQEELHDPVWQQTLQMKTRLKHQTQLTNVSYHTYLHCIDTCLSGNRKNQTSEKHFTGLDLNIINVSDRNNTTFTGPNVCLRSFTPFPPTQWSHRWPWEERPPETHQLLVDSLHISLPTLTKHKYGHHVSIK